MKKMKKFILFWLIAVMVGVLCEVSTAASTSLKNGSVVVTTKGIPYSENPADIKDDGAKIPKDSRLVIYQYGAIVSRVRVSNGKLNGKFVYVRTYHLKTFTIKAI